MKLISKFHDYYDSVLNQGRDETVVYVRERRLADVTLSSDLLPWSATDQRGQPAGLRRTLVRDKANYHGERWENYSRNIQSSTFQSVLTEAFVLIAGKAHSVCVEMDHTDLLVNPAPLPEGVTIGAPTVAPFIDAMIHQTDHLFRGVDLHGQPRAGVKAAQVEAMPARWDKENERRYMAARDRFLAFDHTPFHLEQESPVLLVLPPLSLVDYHHRHSMRQHFEGQKFTGNALVIVNPCLAELNFQKALDPYSCFQEISQFIGGVIPGRQLPLVAISDKSQIVKKGFDPKYGFRTRPHP